MRHARHVESMGRMKNAYKILVENLKRKDHLGDTHLEVDGRIKL
jgi:hypothetical protein